MMRKENEVGDTMDFDILIIGGGPGGYTAAIKAGQLGAKVGIIEKENWGGTCLNWGCIPTKALYKNAEVLRTIKKADSLGITIPEYQLDFNKVQERKNQITLKLVKGVDSLLKANKVQKIKGTASFIDKNTVKVMAIDGSSEEYTAEKIIIATGSKENIPPIEGAKLPGVLTSKSLLEITEIPKSLVVIGGGVIGLEFASIFKAMGTEVKVIEFLPNILASIDRDITKRLMPILKKQGIEIHTSTKVEKIVSLENELVVYAEGKKERYEFKAEKVLLAVGRRPYTEGLNAHEIGIDIEKGAIKVDENYETNISGVYAIGDVTGKVLLAHVAAHQGIKVINDILGQKAIKDSPIPACIFIFPEIATVGITEEKLKEKDIEYKTSKFLFGANGKALTLDEVDGFVKVICDKNDKIIGVHIMGPHASDLINQGTIAISEGMNIDDFKGIIYAHPTLSESFSEAVLGINDEAIHIVPKRKKA